MFENSVHLMGRLTADPEIRVTGENSVCNFTVAINRPAKKDAEHPEADFIRCTAWNKSAELLSKYFGKGDRVGIEGRIQARNYEDKDGNKRNATEVIVNHIAFIERKGESTAKTVDAPTLDDEDDDLPI